MTFTDKEIEELGGVIQGNKIIFKDSVYKIVSYDVKEKHYVCNLIEDIKRGDETCPK
jgi:hypothetical protein